MQIRYAMPLILLLLTFSISGCKYLRSIGRPAGSLGGKGIKSLKVTVPPETKLCPGSSVQLKVVATSHEGDTYTTGKDTTWGNFDISMRGGVVAPRGMLQMTGDPRLSWNHSAAVDVVLLHNPKVRASLEIEPRYDCRYRAHFDKGRGKAMELDGTLDIVGERDGQPIGRLILSSADTRRAGMFYLSRGSVVEIILPEVSPPRAARVHIRVDPAAISFRDSIRLSPRTARAPEGKGSHKNLRFTEEELFLP